jgi:hypothetical protein
MSTVASEWWTEIFVTDAINPSLRLASDGSAAECLQIVREQFHDELFIAWVTPAIAIDSTDQRLTVVVDFYNGAIAVGGHI